MWPKPEMPMISSDAGVDCSRKTYRMCDIVFSYVSDFLSMTFSCLFQLNTLEFPPKKLFGNKDERVIAERRAQLEVSAPHYTAGQD